MLAPKDRQTPCAWTLRRLAPGDAHALAAFYNGLSQASIRTFRPLGPQTTLETCEDIVRANQPPSPHKYDIIALHEGRIAGWSFLWNLDTEKPVFGLGVADALHGAGLGSALMDAVLHFADTHRIPLIALTVVQTNAKAFAMYSRRGFITQESLRGEDGLDYYYMTRTLPA